MHRDFHNLADLSRKDSPLGHRDRLIRSPRLMHKFPTEKDRSSDRISFSVAGNYGCPEHSIQLLGPLPGVPGGSAGSASRNNRAAARAAPLCRCLCHPPTPDAHAARTGENPDRDGVGLTSVGRGREARDEPPDEAARGSIAREAVHMYGDYVYVGTLVACSPVRLCSGCKNQLTAVTVTDPRVPRFSPTKRNT